MTDKISSVRTGRIGRPLACITKPSGQRAGGQYKGSTDAGQTGAVRRGDLGRARSARARPHGDVSGTGGRGLRRPAAQARAADRSQIGPAQERGRDVSEAEAHALVGRPDNSGVILEGSAPSAE